MKKLIILILTMAVLPFTAIQASAEEEYLNRADAARRIVTAVFLSSDTNPFSFEDYYCMHPGGGGYIHFVPDEDLIKKGYPILCEVYSTVDGCGFSDISDENENLSVYITLAKEMRIVAGYEDNTFRPDRLVTFNEAVTMLVCAFGHGDLAKARGGYPDGYIKAAEEMGIKTDMGVEGDGPVSSLSFDEMLAAAIAGNISAAGIDSYSVHFIPPVTEDECVLAYADAVMNRNGAAQFALFDGELKDAKRKDYEGFRWVTGVSSPWVTGYDIEKINTLEHEIKFYYATSTGPSGDMTVKLTLEQIDGCYRITGIL